MQFKRYRDEGFGSSWTFQIGWLQLDWTKFENHWHFQIMWAKPLKDK